MSTSKLYKACLTAVGGKRAEHKVSEMMELAEQLTEIGFTEYREIKVFTETR